MKPVPGLADLESLVQHSKPRLDHLPPRPTARRTHMRLVRSSPAARHRSYRFDTASAASAAISNLMLCPLFRLLGPHLLRLTTEGPRAWPLAGGRSSGLEAFRQLRK